jgi:hypothetical protein
MRGWLSRRLPNSCCQPSSTAALAAALAARRASQPQPPAPKVCVFMCMCISRYMLHSPPPKSHAPDVGCVCVFVRVCVCMNVSMCV